MLENEFKRKLKNEIKELFPDAIVTNLNPNDIQGIPDLLILNNDKWATLEGKQSSKAKKRPNQPYYVDKMNQMSFSRFVYPENKEEVLNELRQAFGS